MALTVNTNVSSLTAQRNLAASSNRLNTSLERLSTGLRINKAADSASGLVISETQRAQISGLNGAIANIDRATNAAQTAESALGEVNSVLLSMRQLAVDSANEGAQDSASLAANQAEFANLQATITSIVDNTKFGNSALISKTTNGGADFIGGKKFQTGAFSGETSTFSFSSGLPSAFDAAGLSLGATVLVDSATNATTALTAIDQAISDVATARGDLGAFQKNTLGATQSNLRSQLQNLQEAESSLRETDYNAEITKFTNEQIRNQASSTVLGLANQSAQSILSLLRG